MAGDVDIDEAIAKFRKAPLVFETVVTDISHVDKGRARYLSRLSAEAWVPPAQRPPKHETVIIFDWDDTLLCSSYISYHASLGRNMPSSTKHHLQSIGKSAYELLEIALSLGHTFIITNAAEGWVEESAKLYLPRVVPLLQDVHIISARSTQKAYSGDISEWKVRTFLELSAKLDSETITNLVSIGDSDFECDAARTFGRQFWRGLTKVVKLQEKPSPEALSKQLSVLVGQLPGIVEKTSNLNLALKRKDDSEKK
jgi:hypothetical protein